jgi:hypothetical protein
MSAASADLVSADMASSATVILAKGIGIGSSERCNGSIHYYAEVV